MALQTPRGIPVPEEGDDVDPPADITRLASFLDPGALSTYSPGSTGVGLYFVLMHEGDGDPNQQGIAVTKGTVYFDRQGARLWVPLTLLVNGVQALAWFQLGSDQEEEIQALQAALGSTLSTSGTGGAEIRSASVLLASGVPAGNTSSQFQAGVTFQAPFDSNALSVVVSNGDGTLSPQTTVELIGSSRSGFSVLISRPSDPFGPSDQVAVDYVAVGN